MKPTVSIAIDVPDLKQAASFYTEVLGFAVKRDGESNIIISANNVDIWLLKKEAGTNPLPHGEVVRSYERHWTPIHLDFVTQDIDEVVKKVVTHSGAHEGGESGDWGSIAYCADPFGNGFCVINE